ncbi:hypothetical protein [Pseudoduganella buxea]|uniref:Uncharacterized protein n=1 Tax=Pseudoduganella buxea TaxID=1949069 RepID=A0A6I3T150_9BURK|nr:hypothetical protein [Pseudoduganella buxea]MTV54212.1 hypothetical protein [Pseudoduganella buxea]GGB82579.1 hypothetical protein GCM10011572_00610 [Pseudoduganella buxea]
MTDPVDPHCSAPEDGQAPFQLRSTVDAAALERMAPALEAILLGRLMAHRARFVKPYQPRPRLAAFIKRCCVAGLLLSLAFTASGGLEFGPYRLDLLCAVAFVAILALSFVPPRLEAWVRRPWHRYWHHLARVRTNTILKAARASAPFDAQYDIDEGQLRYTRIRGDDGEGNAQVQWRRPLAGIAVPGPGFTLLFKHARALGPTLIVLHAPSAAFDAMLARHGVHCLPPA